MLQFGYEAPASAHRLTAWQAAVILIEPGSRALRRFDIHTVKPTVLVVDDSGFMRLALTHILKNSGFEVIGEASDGEQAIAFCKGRRPDLVTMDILMPGKDGLEALKEIKLFDPTIRVVMVSAMGQRRNVMDALSLGADNFIVKPFDDVKIQRVLRALDFTVERPVSG